MVKQDKDSEKQDRYEAIESKQAPGDISWIRLDEETGVWTFGLTQVTVCFVIIIQISFMIMLYLSCSLEYNQCSDRMPMISDVIKDPMFDRVFLLLNTGYFIGIHQVNVRSLYSRF